MCTQTWGSGCSSRATDKTACLLVKPGISTEKRSYVALNAGLVNNLVNLVGGDAWPQGSSRDIQNFSRQTADLAHAILLLGVELLNLVRPNERSASLGNTIFGVIGVRYRLGDFALGRKRINWSEGSREAEGWEWVVVAGVWIGFRNHLGYEQVSGVKYTGLCLVHGLVCGLLKEKKVSTLRCWK